MKKTTNKLSSSLEDYLEAIFNIITLKKAARPKDISQALKVNNSSVTEALNTLSKKELINYAPYELITMTPKGEKEAKKIVKRHKILCDFFSNILLLDKENSEEVACKVEHVIPNSGIEKIAQLNKFLTEGKTHSPDWKTSFLTYINTDKRG